MLDLKQLADRHFGLGMGLQKSGMGLQKNGMGLQKNGPHAKFLKHLKWELAGALWTLQRSGR